MVDRLEVLAIIPARGGSKGIPRKNVRLFAGHPLIAFSIAAGRSALTVTRTIVSTDDDEIADVARDHGAEVPFMRPAELAQDDTLDLPVFVHALKWLAEHEDYRPALVVQLRPTSPVRPRALVDDAVRLMLTHPQADSVRGIVPAGQNPYKMWRIEPQTGVLRPLLAIEGLSEPYNSPRQMLPDVYWQAGHIDVLRPATTFDQQSMSGQTVLPIHIDRRYTVDIDTDADWVRSEWLVLNGGLDLVMPGQASVSQFARVQALVLDFDGVLTDDKVIVFEDGREAVRCHRGDGYGLARLREAGVSILVLSKERNPVVGARCEKLHVQCIQGCDDKLTALKSWTSSKGLQPDQLAYVGNDLNDLTCLQWVGLPIAVADAADPVRAVARWVTCRRGGHGAVREVADRLLAEVR